ncbi:MAG: glycosyltransferase [Ignavibacteria bacterium]|nr:glycosyltransferase [Ignavibacteria bacterium]
MKIIIIGTAYPMRGGMAHFNELMYKYLSIENDVKIYSFKRQYPEFLFPGKTQFEEGKPLTEFAEGSNIISIDSINPFNWIKWGFNIAKENADLIIIKYWIPFFAPAFFTLAWIIRKFSKAKVLFQADNVIPHEKRFGDKFLTKVALSQGDIFQVLSESVAEDLKLFNKKNKPVIRSKHPVYNLFGEKVEKREAREYIKKEFGVDVISDKVILFFGYIRKYKGLNYLIDAMKEVVKKLDVKLLVVGEFYEDENKYMEQIKNNNLEKNILVISDFMPNEKVRYFFSACDLVVLPYNSATQSGITQIAYFYDKPVVATKVGGLSEVIHDGETGYLVEPKNSPQIADAILKFYSENMESEFSKKVSEEKKKYMWEKFVNEITSNVKLIA